MFSPELTDILDKLMRHDLADWRTLWFTWLDRSTLAVVAGLVLEGPELALDLAHIINRRRQKRRTGLTLPTAEMPDWVKIFAFVGWVLIVAGVAGELYTQSYVSDADTDIQAFNSGALAEAQNKASTARVLAGLADLEAARANEHAAKLETKAESERLARIKLEASVGWRHLTDQQQQGIGMDLRIRFSKGIIGIWFMGADIEGSRFASDIAEAMRDAKLMVWPPKNIIDLRTGGPINGPIERDPTGIFVEPTTTDPRSGLLATAIRDELTSRGFDATLKPASAEPKSSAFQPEVTITVEPRP
jgi:hypothetical protein